MKPLITRLIIYLGLPLLLLLGLLLFIGTRRVQTGGDAFAILEQFFPICECEISQSKIVAIDLEFGIVRIDFAASNRFLECYPLSPGINRLQSAMHEVLIYNDGTGWVQLLSVPKSYERHRPYLRGFLKRYGGEIDWPE